jgi:hypothetical protein
MTPVQHMAVTMAGQETLQALKSAQCPACLARDCLSACGGGQRAEVTYYSGFMMAAWWEEC